MKAVNLIPRDAAKGARGGIAGGTGTGGAIGAYVVLAVLAVVAVMAGANALAGRQLSAKQGALVVVEREAQAAGARAAALKSYTDLAAQRKSRVDTVKGLLAGRFDWSQSLREVARAVPSDVSLTSLVGTVAPDTAVEGAGGATLRAALAVPAIDLIGCAKSHGDVSRLLASLRSIDGVQRVSLASSEKSDATAPSDTDCRANDKMPQFQLTVFYEAREGIVPAVDATAPAPANGAAPAGSPAPAPAPASGAAPAGSPAAAPAEGAG